MKVKIMYDVSAEKLEALMKDEDVIKAEIVLNKSDGYDNLDDVVEEWLTTHDVDGYAVSYARDLFMGSDLGKKFPGLSSKRFVKAVKATDKYVARNTRIGNAVVYTFVAFGK